MSGATPLTGRQQVQLLRLGKKLVLVAVTATEARTLSEVTDPLEVDRLSGLCQQNRPESITASFRQVLAQCATEPVSRVSAAANRVAGDRATGIDQRGEPGAPSMSQTAHGRGRQITGMMPSGWLTRLVAPLWWAIILCVPQATAWGQPPAAPRSNPGLPMSTSGQREIEFPGDRSGASPTGSSTIATVPSPTDALAAPALPPFLTSGPDAWTSPEGLTSSLKIMLMLTVLSLAPAVLLMTTCFVRIIVVLGLLRQALGLQQLPPSQVITSIALFLTVLVMTPVWTDVYNDAIAPYSQSQSKMSLEEAWQAGIRPIHRFMSRQIEAAGNSDDIWLFYNYMPQGTPPPQTYEDVPLRVLLPAFMLSELKTSFLIGFQIYLPFLVLDIVIASITISMGMLMLPPVMISLPFKLMLFVLVDGWRLVVGMLLESFAPYT